MNLIEFMSFFPPQTEEKKHSCKNCVYYEQKNLQCIKEQFVIKSFGVEKHQKWITEGFLNNNNCIYFKEKYTQYESKGVGFTKISSIYINELTNLLQEHNLPENYYQNFWQDIKDFFLNHYSGTIIEKEIKSEIRHFLSKQKFLDIYKILYKN